ncbi:integrase core domain-containing protein [Streptomyces diastatochromogenes]|uniref:integrase core domain-containing protein n=1 Tax=Streptomyces diastatochromogenes TaxID=42236 RepID=UPI0036B44A9F
MRRPSPRSPSGIGPLPSSRPRHHTHPPLPERERRVALAEFVNSYNHERPHAALGGRPPISRTAGSDYRIVFDQPPEPLADIPQRLTSEDFA